METFTLQFTGLAPLLMHRPTLVNPLDPVKQEIARYTGKRKKTIEDYEIIARLEWEAGLYHDSEIGPYLPGQNIEICLRDSGKISKQGAAISRAVIVLEDKVPVQYRGPRGTNGAGVQELWDANYKDMRPVGVQQNSPIRCRPKFPQWQLVVPIGLQTNVLDPDDLYAIAERAGVMIGIGDYRPRFGRFDVERMH